EGQVRAMKLREVAGSGICTAWTDQLILAASMAPGCRPGPPMRGNNSPARGAAPPQDHDHRWNISPCARAPFSPSRAPGVRPRPAPSTLVTARKGAWLLPGLFTVGRAMAAVVAG